MLRDRLLQLMQDIWRNGEVVAGWKDAQVVPVPKNGDLQNGDNWCGISLLDVVGKVYVQIIKDSIALQRTSCLNLNVVFKGGVVAMI